MFYVQAANGMLFQEVLELQVQYMIDSKNGEHVFKRMWIDGLSVYDKKTGIDWKWQAMAQHKGASWGKNVQVQIPQTELNLVLSEVWS